MTEYELANGYTLTDEEIEKRAAEYESGTWEGRLESIHAGRAPISDEPLVTVAVKFPASMVAAIDSRTDNRSDYIRRAVAATLTSAEH